MIRVKTSDEFFNCFNSTLNPFLSNKYISANSFKVEDLLFLTENDDKPSIGIVFGIENNLLVNPFSAPFGGFHYTHENIYISKIEAFVQDLHFFFGIELYTSMRFVIPPSIYGSSFNAKMVNSMVRNGFHLDALELTSFVDLMKFDERFSVRSSREYYNQAKRNNLNFKKIEIESEKREIIELVRDNRERKERILRMTYEDFLIVENIWQVDYLGVLDEHQQIVAGGIFYKFHDNNIIYIAIWGDSPEGRRLRAMDFLIFESWMFYKNLGVRYIDLGISTEGKGEPNEGLLRFKETHEATTELRYIISLDK